MIQVNQTIVDRGRGDCLRAAVASLLDLEILQVPHFILFKDGWWNVFYHFLESIGYELHGTGYPKSHKSAVADYPNVNGYVIATVPSKEFAEFKDVTHAVVMSVDGLVVHDPQPNKAYQGINVIETGELISWSLIGNKVDD
jgi:hypothetical protein